MRAQGLSQGCLAKGFRVKAGRGDGWSPPCGDARGARNGCATSISAAHPHSSESQNEAPACIDRQERLGTNHHFKKARGIYLRKDGCSRPLSS